MSRKNPEIKIKKTKQSETKQLVLGALIAALYVGLTLISNSFGMAYGPIQFRISEALTILPLFTPAAIWGLTLGCFIANLFSSIDLVADMTLGTAASLLAALCTYFLRFAVIKIKTVKLPLLSILMPVIFNAALVGAELMLFLDKTVAIEAFGLNALFVGLGELAVCVLLGIPLFITISKNKKLYRLISG